nr:CAP domain-containing protein [Patulibacter sp. SYSU D01012]
MVFGPYLTPGDHPGQSAEEAAIVQGVNEQRALVGAPPLIADKKLFGAADMQAAWMRRTQRVPTPDDPDSWGEEQSSHYERARHYGFIEELYTGRLAETVAHQVDGPTTLAAWMQNADDRSRLLDPRWRYIGVGADATSYAATLAEYDTMCQKASCGPPAYDGGATPLIAPPAQLPPPQAPPRSAPACAPRWRTAPTARRLSRTRVRLTLRVRCAGRTTRPVVRVGGRARGRTVRLRMRRTQTVVTTAKTLRVALRTGRSTARWVVVRVAPRR